ncbi:hypothetical protein BROWWM01_37800 [Bradyrhizobium ottawaense]
MRILIGDDHPLVQAALRSALSAVLPDLDVIACQSLDEAIGVLTAQSGEIDLILWDLTMPGIQGFAALFILSAQLPTVPVAIISARQDATTIRRAIAYGASGYIPKSLGLPRWPRRSPGFSPARSGCRPMSAAAARSRAPMSNSPRAWPRCRRSSCAFSR